MDASYRFYYHRSESVTIKLKWNLYMIPLTGRRTGESCEITNQNHDTCFLNAIDSRRTVNFRDAYRRCSRGSRYTHPPLRFSLTSAQCWCASVVPAFGTVAASRSSIGSQHCHLTQTVSEMKNTLVVNVINYSRILRSIWTRIYHVRVLAERKQSTMSAYIAPLGDKWNLFPSTPWIGRSERRLWEYLWYLHGWVLSLPKT